MLHHYNRSKDGSDRSRRSSTQHESPLEKYRKAIPTLPIGHATKKEWQYVIYPYRNEVKKNIAWVAERPSFADEMLEYLESGVSLLERVEAIIGDTESASKLKESEDQAGNSKDNGNHWKADLAAFDMKRILTEVQSAYQSQSLEEGVLYGFGRHIFSDQKGPEAGWLKQFYKYTCRFLEAKEFGAVREAAAALRRARNVQESMCEDCHSRVENAYALFRKMQELENKMKGKDIDNASRGMDELHRIESELEQIDGEAHQLRRKVNSRHRELEEALKTPRRLWKEKHPDQYQKKSKSATGEIISKIKRLSGNSNQSSTRSSDSSLRDSS